MSDRSLRSFDSLPDRLRLHFQGNSRSVVIVEGENDRLILGEILPDRDLFPAGTRSEVLSVAKKLHDLGLCGFAAVFDADFDLPPPPFGLPLDGHLHPYEKRDLESMLIDLGGLDRLLLYKGSTSKIEDMGGVQTLVAQVKEVVEPISRLRARNSEATLGLRFDAVPLQEKIGLRDLSLSLTGYCTALVGASDGRAKLGDVLAFAANAGEPLEPRGKDVVAVAGVALRSRAGNLSKAACDAEILARDLLAVSHLILRQSSWFMHLSTLLESGDRGQLACV